MRHLVQPSGWSCLATSFAMVLDTSVWEVFQYTGHDGSAIAFPSLREPACRRGHTLYEMVMFALHKGYSCSPMMPNYTHVSVDGDELEVSVNPKVIDELYSQENMVLVGTMPSGQGHAMAWDKERVLCPGGNFYTRGNIPLDIEVMLLCSQLKWPPTLSGLSENTLQTKASTN